MLTQIIQFGTEMQLQSFLLIETCWDACMGMQVGRERLRFVGLTVVRQMPKGGTYIALASHVGSNEINRIGINNIDIDFQAGFFNLDTSCGNRKVLSTVTTYLYYRG